ncbi:hypothetical protein GCM10018775_62170 [Streptomyces umbrinus]|nr:hypothetical protein GCM10018775_62170 [Streptomyces umbrinus]
MLGTEIVGGPELELPFRFRRHGLVQEEPGPGGAEGDARRLPPLGPARHQPRIGTHGGDGVPSLPLSHQMRALSHRDAGPVTPPEHDGGAGAEIEDLHTYTGKEREQSSVKGLHPASLAEDALDSPVLY